MLGTAYLNLNQNEQARDEFSQAVALDDHLPNTHLNLGFAYLALKENAKAEESFRKGSSIAPLDKQLQMALVYSELVNRDYDAVIDAANQLHQKKHKGTEIVHLFAAGALGAKNNLDDAQHEMEKLLEEDPESPSAELFRQIRDGIKTQRSLETEAELHPSELQKLSFRSGSGPSEEEASRLTQQTLQNLSEQRQIAEAEAAPEPTCSESGTTVPNSNTVAKQPESKLAGPVFRAQVDEVGVFFAATNHGKSVTDLTEADIALHDSGSAPETIRGFRNVAQLPLRLGLIIDTSESVTRRFSFEQKAATRFLQDVITDKNDQAFVIGVSNSVLLVQDYTADQTLTARAINRLAPGGGTALWDAVSFAADKLANLRETRPVARVLVVISDGKDNSSSAGLKGAIDSSLRGEVAVYTVSSHDLAEDSSTNKIGDGALKTLSELTGGAASVPGSLHRFAASLSDVQEMIRGRYLVSYKPANFDRDGRYRKVEIKAQKGRRQFKVYARKGYYAALAEPEKVQPVSAR